MKDGRYEYEFIAFNDHQKGTMTLAGQLAEGDDAVHVLRGQLSLTGTNLLASFEVQRKAPRTGGGAYMIRMFGSGTETMFNVIGLGPLGLIVELRGHRLDEAAG